jgi:lipopolysaccharide biosynthesis glycosyltransferase
VACAADAAYALPLAVMLLSAGANASAGVSLHAYVLDDGVPPEEKNKVAASLPANVSVEWRNPATPLHDLPTWGRMPLTTYQKLTMDEWVPNDVDRVLWLDCDILALGDLAPLWRKPLEGKLLLAVQDQRVPLVSSRFGVAAWRELGLDPNAMHFNAGVLLIDLAQWRTCETRRRSLAYIRTYAPRIYFWDQEALNAVTAGHWGELDPCWNWHPSLAGLLPRDQCPAVPQILHFSGNLKPWKVKGGGPHRDIYDSYLNRTAWQGTRGETRYRDKILGWYETSPVRRLLYPAEQYATMGMRLLTRRLNRL